MRYLAFFLLLFVFASCADKKRSVEEKEELEFESDVVVGQEQDEIRLGEGTVVETVDDNESLRILKDALRVTELDSVLSAEGPYTLFAPSDKAFEELVPVGQNNLPDDMDEEELKQILLNHVVEGKLSSTDLQEGQTLTTLGGGELTVMEIESQMKIDSADLVFIDREADNGYVHIIDRVLMPN
jgi:uncharacterized surface protein with fasciclin (FAS1) repeats